MTFDDAHERMHRTSEHWRQWITLGDFPDHRWRSYLQRSALTLKGLTYAPTGALLAAATTSLPETPHGRAQLGLPLRLGARLHLRPVGSLHPGLRPRGQRLLLLHRRRLPRRPGPPGHVRRRRRARADRGVAAAPVRLRGRLAGPDRQRRLQPAPARRVGRRARLGPAARPIAVPAAGVVLARPQASGRVPPASTGRSPTAASGRCGASRSTSPPASSCAGWPSTGAPGWPACTTSPCTRTSGRPSPTRSTPTSAPHGVDQRGVFVQRYGSTALDASLLLLPLLRFLPPGGSPHPGHRAGHRRRADPRGAGAPLSGRARPTTAWRARRARSPSAPSGWCRP